MTAASGSEEGQGSAGAVVPFTPDYAAAGQMAIRASSFAIRGRDLDFALDYSDASIEAADDTGVQLWESLAPDSAGEESEEVRANLIVELGAYFGETLRRNRGGRWGWTTMDGRRVFAFRTDAGLTAFPLHSARKRLRGEDLDSLVVLYQFLSR